jgi:hypothetical protein
VVGQVLVARLLSDLSRARVGYTMYLENLYGQQGSTVACDQVRAHPDKLAELPGLALLSPVAATNSASLGSLLIQGPGLLRRPGPTGLCRCRYPDLGVAFGRLPSLSGCPAPLYNPDGQLISEAVVGGMLV